MRIGDLMGHTFTKQELRNFARMSEDDIKRVIRTTSDGPNRQFLKQVLRQMWFNPEGAGLGRPGDVSESEECEDCEECEYEMVFVDENDDIITEASIRQFKRVGSTVKVKYRCMSGPKQGKLVSEPGKCATRKDPKKVRHGRKVMRAKKGTIKRKAAVAKRRQISRMVQRMNKRLAGKGK